MSEGTVVKKAKGTKTEDEKFEGVGDGEFFKDAKKFPKNKESEREKFTNSVIKSAKLDGIPEISEIMSRQIGSMMKIKDISIFISEPEDVILKEVMSECSIVNRVNLSTTIILSRVRANLVKIFTSGFMANPIIPV